MKATYIDDYFVIPIKVGDTILTGRFRNKPVKVKQRQKKRMVTKRDIPDISKNLQ